MVETLKSQNNNSDITYKPIGIFTSFYSPNIGSPRQGILSPESKAEIQIFSEYQEGLKDLENFEYIIVIYHLHEVRQWSPIIAPPSATIEHEFGIFATRSPKRPNPIGFAVIKLDKIENGILYVSGIDAFDKTPVLDIKPYLPSIDCIKSVKNSSLELQYGHHDEDFISDTTLFR